MVMKSLLLSLFLTTGAQSCQTTEPFVPSDDFCAEIAMELDRAVKRGDISSDKARTIARRCFETYPSN